MPLGDGRIARYNGVLVAADRIEGRFFVTVDRGRKRGIPAIFSVQANVSHTHNAENPMKTAHDFETFSGWN